MLGRDEVVLERLRFVFGLLQELERAPRRFGSAPPLTLGYVSILASRAPGRRVGIGARLLHERPADAALLLDDGAQEVLGIELRVAATAGEVDGSAHGLLGSWSSSGRFAWLAETKADPRR